VEGRECRIGNPGSAWGSFRFQRKSPTSRKEREKWGTRLGLSVGAFGTLGMHSPKVPHPDFSVQVVRHNLKIFCCGKLFEGKALGVGERNRVLPSVTASRTAPLKPKSGLSGPPLPSLAGCPGSCPKRETSFAFRLKGICTGKAGGYRSEFGQTQRFVCTLCKYSQCIILGAKVRIARISECTALRLKML
jgi:hypothetical protein